MTQVSDEMKTVLAQMQEMITASQTVTTTLVSESSANVDAQIGGLKTMVSTGIEAVKSEMLLLDRKANVRITSIEAEIRKMQESVNSHSKQLQELDGGSTNGSQSNSTFSAAASSVPSASNTAGSTQTGSKSSAKRVRTDDGGVNQDPADVEEFENVATLFPPCPPPRGPHPDDVISPERRGLGGAINDGSSKFKTLKLGGDWKDSMSKVEGMALAKSTSTKMLELAGMSNIKVKIYVNKKEKGLDTSLVFPSRTLAFQVLDAARMETDGPLPVGDSSVYISMQKVGSALEKERKIKRAVASLRHVLGVPDSGTTVVKGDFRRMLIKFVKEADVVVGKIVDEEGVYKLVCQTANCNSKSIDVQAWKNKCAAFDISNQDSLEGFE